eukprot:s1859_g4.t3
MVTFGALVANWPIFDTEYRHDEFWRSLSQKVELEPFAALTRVLGRCHRFVCWQQKKTLALESADFAKQCVQLYESVASLAVKPQLTPHLDVSTLPAADDETRGQLIESAARILMKILWLARLSRPDLLVAVTTLASHVCSWSKNDDRRVHSLESRLREGASTKPEDGDHHTCIDERSS